MTKAQQRTLDLLVPFPDYGAPLRERRDLLSVPLPTGGVGGKVRTQLKKSGKILLFLRDLVQSRSLIQRENFDADVPFTRHAFF
jgi:hypothetical protein